MAAVAFTSSDGLLIAAIVVLLVFLTLLAVAETGINRISVHKAEAMAHTDPKRGRALQGRRRIGDGVVQRLGRRLATHVRVLVAVLGRRRLAHQPVAESLEQVLQGLAVVGLQRGQDLVELHGC